MMVDVIVQGVNDRALAALEERAKNRGVSLDAVIREIVEADALLTPSPTRPEPPRLSAQESAQRRAVAARMAEIRSQTLKPLWADSTLLIREDRDTR
jgi:hypothetical protein